MKAISTKFIPCTNYRGSRISATAEGGCRVIVDYYHEVDNETAHWLAAAALCRKYGWTGTLVCGGTKTGFVFVFTETVSGYKSKRYQIRTVQPHEPKVVKI